MPNTYTLIASVTVGSGGAASIDFTSIPSTYTNLSLKISARQNSATVAYSNLRFNASTTGYSYRSLQGDGSGASSASGSTATYGVTNLSTWTASTFNSIDLYIPNYAGSNYKSWSSDSVTEANISTVYSDFVAGLWSNTAAINQVTLYPNGGNFVQYSSAYLYGISKS
jgi:hypothetical protein